VTVIPTREPYALQCSLWYTSLWLAVSCLKGEESNPKPGGSSAYRGPGTTAPAPDNCPRTIRR